MPRLLSRFCCIAQHCAPLSLAGTALAGAALITACSTSAAERSTDPDSVEIPAFDSVTILQLPGERRISAARTPKSAPKPTLPKLSPLADSIGEGLVFMARTQRTLL